MVKREDESDKEGRKVGLVHRVTTIVGRGTCVDYRRSTSTLLDWVQLSVHLQPRMRPRSLRFASFSSTNQLLTTKDIYIHSERNTPLYLLEAYKHPGCTRRRYTQGHKHTEQHLASLYGERQHQQHKAALAFVKRVSTDTDRTFSSSSSQHLNTGTNRMDSSARSVPAPARPS